jgi:hypothetical protein
MLEIILILLIVFWFLGYGPLVALKIPLFSIGRISVDLWDVLIFLLIIWLIDLLPGPVRSIVVIALIIWLLGFFGLIAIPMFNNLVVIAVIVGLGLYLISKR